MRKTLPHLISKYGGNKGDLVIKVEFNDQKDLFYSSNVKVLETSKMFNLLGGKIGDVYHYGFRGGNSLVKKNDSYYFLKGNINEKRKLKDYFLFKVFSLSLWVLIPFLSFVIPYSQTLFLVEIISLSMYLILINILMEMEV